MLNSRRIAILTTLACSATLSTMYLQAKRANACIVGGDTSPQKILVSKASQKDLENSVISTGRRRLKVYLYYSDARHTTMVGRGVFRCNGRSELHGQSTPYYVVILNEPCDGDVPA